MQAPFSGRGPQRDVVPPPTWACSIETTNAYDTCCGAMTNITYSDGTPSITYTCKPHRPTANHYRRRGNVDVPLQSGHAAVTNEMLVSTEGATSLLSRAHDTLGRPVGTYLRDVPPSVPTYATTYTFHLNSLQRHHRDRKRLRLHGPPFRECCSVGRLGRNQHLPLRRLGHDPGGQESGIRSHHI